jgi:hypothetical protein
MMYDDCMITFIIDEDDRCGNLVQLLKASIMSMIHAMISESPARSDGEKLLKHLLSLNVVDALWL